MLLDDFFKEYNDLNITQLGKIYNGVSYKMETLQKKMKDDIISNGGCVDLPYYDILPRNFSLIDIDYCSLHDKKLLCELHMKRFKVYWLLEYKKALMKNEDEVIRWKSNFILYFFHECIDDNVWNNMLNDFDNVILVGSTHSIAYFIEQIIKMKEVDLIYD